MIRINQLKIPITNETVTQNKLRKEAADFLKIDSRQIVNLSIYKKSLDARKKPSLFWIYSLDVTLTDPRIEEEILSPRCRKKYKNNVLPAKFSAYQMPEKLSGKIPSDQRPVIIGTGPAGLFCGYLLSLLGFCPILIDRGLPVEERKAKVEQFWNNNTLDKDCNIQFGEGGAGTFSDGKLQTQVKDPYGRIRKVLEIFVSHGAPEEILYLNKPHIGTDILADVIVSMRKDMISRGAEFHFSTCFDEFTIAGNTVKGIWVSKTDGSRHEIKAGAVVLAPGHSARDTFETLLRQDVFMENKPFAVGYRVLHPQHLINKAQYGENYEELNLPAADYKLTYSATSGRGVYSFCMCPGGYVVNASSEEGMLAVNGMSYHKRDSDTANSAIVMTVSEEDYGKNLLDGMRFQRDIEKRAFEKGDGCMPVEKCVDFVNGTFSQEQPLPKAVKGGTKAAELRGILPESMERDFCEAMLHFNEIIPGFLGEEAAMIAVESRTSSPVKIVRNDNMQSNISHLFPCGEGAGYAGGITSAAIDGLKVAEKIVMLYNNESFS